MQKSPLLVAILGALAGCTETFEDTGCLVVEAEVMSCPADNEVSPADLFLPGKCGELEIVDVLGPGTREELYLDSVDMKTPACCYPVKVVDHDPSSKCDIGRPYFENGHSLSAPLHGDARSAQATLRARAWAEAGAAEHASVAAFARLSLQLLRHGAPSALLRDVHQAALDEIRHSELCWSLVEHFGGGRVRAGGFPFAAPVATDVSLAELAVAALREGCLAETLGAHVVAVAAGLANEPAVRAVLASIAAEESRHAVLSFRIVAWAQRAGGAEVKAAVRAALEVPWPELDVEELALRAGVDAEALSAAARHGTSEVLTPAVLQLLAA